jgi:hypothetical protein
VFNFAAEEAHRLAEQKVGPEHLLLGLLREKDTLAAVILRQFGADGEAIRLKLGGSADRYREPDARGSHYRIATPPGRAAMNTLSSFLSGLKDKSSPQLADLFAENSQFIDAFGKIWFGRQEIRQGAESLFAPYAKRNTTFRMERIVSERPEAVVTSVLWENALHTDLTPRSVLRMTVVLVPDGIDWMILLIQLFPLLHSADGVSQKSLRTTRCPAYSCNCYSSV